MYLFKCECGCVFTVKSLKLESTAYFKCQNCGKDFSLSRHIECDEFKQRLKDIGMTLQIIPDDAKITVSFEA